MKREDYKITIKKNEDNFFSYTDQLDSYLMLHVNNESKSDGFITENTLLFSDFVIKIDGIEYKRTQSDYTELYSDCFTVKYKKFNIKVTCYVVYQQSNLLFEISNPNEVQFDFVMLRNTEVLKSNRITEKTSYLSLFDKVDKESAEENIIAQIKKHKEYYEALESHLNFDCGNHLINKALYWAQLSGLSLCTGPLDKRGIWAGLPWFRENWGRDTFIALPGILLVNGFFDQAKTIIKCFIKYQNTDIHSSNYGRIPNRYKSKDDVIYNTAEGNLWYIKVVYQYLQYTGDTELLKDIWDNIKLAVFADLDLRCDENGFLLNNDSDTWMDARINGSEPLSARGNRANDVEALWFETLNIFIELSKILNSTERVDEIKEVINNLRINFTKIFWDDERLILADCVHKDNTKDLRIRPNQMFCVNIEHSLLSQDIQRQITLDCYNKLTLPHGVASLSPLDEDFHPYHDGCDYYHKDAAYHNGAIWLWLTGPLVSCLTKFNLQDKAFSITKNHCIQILKDKCVGTLSENADAALTNRGSIQTSGTWSQAWSVSEFNRNFYQDYLGIHPNMLEKTIYFNPKLPVFISSGSTDIYVEDSVITVTWTRQIRGIRSFIFKLNSENKKQYIIKNYNRALDKNIDYVLSEMNPVEIHSEIEKANEKVKFVRLKPLKQYKCFTEKNYLFNKITAEYKDKEIKGVN